MPFLYNLFMERLLDFIVPVYGKNPSDVYNTLSKLTKTKINGIGWVIVYKNSIDDSLNYDKLNNLSSDNVKVLKGEAHWKKTMKVKHGIKNSNAFYIMPMDSHHTIKMNVLKKSMKKIQKFKEKDITIIWHKFIAWNVDTHFRDWIGPTNKTVSAGTQILKRELITLEDIKYDIVFVDDATYGYNVMFKNGITYGKIRNRFYVRRRGKNLSNTYGKKDFEKNKIIYQDSKLLVDFILEKTRFFYNESGIDFFDKDFSLAIIRAISYSFNAYKNIHNEEEIETKNLLIDFFDGDVDLLRMIIDVNKKAFRIWPWLWGRFKLFNINL